MQWRFKWRFWRQLNVTRWTDIISWLLLNVLTSGPFSTQKPCSICTIGHTFKMKILENVWNLSLLIVLNTLKSAMLLYSPIQCSRSSLLNSSFNDLHTLTALKCSSVLHFLLFFLFLVFCQKTKKETLLESSSFLAYY